MSTRRRKSSPTMAQQWLTQFSDIADVGNSLEKAEIPRDQDWENEATLWTFADGSVIEICGTELVVGKRRNFIKYKYSVLGPPRIVIGDRGRGRRLFVGRYGVK